jgi:hypothetical protein
MTDDWVDLGLLMQIADFRSGIGNLNPHSPINQIRNQQSSIANRIARLQR